MQQLEIRYFFPLTEQINLDLDFTPCLEYIEERRRAQIAASTLNTITLGEFQFYGNGNLTQGFYIDTDVMPITVRSVEKPNLIKRYVYKVLGVKWETK